jgi:uncharacterized protein (DUF488 family)
MPMTIISMQKMPDSSPTTTQVYTIGFTKKGAEKFFSLLMDSRIERLVDVRIRNRSQLSGFAKRDDLRYFLNKLLEAEYQHKPELAPTEDLLDDWRDDEISWKTYEERFTELMSDREIEKRLDRELFSEPTVLLCSEHKPDHCHRRLVVEYLDEQWGDIESIHLIE